jgi:2-polyprenyl-6-methoxyphenol hydroxylase-like FAD-dependent oxidoreductase
MRWLSAPVRLDSRWRHSFRHSEHAFGPSIGILDRTRESRALAVQARTLELLQMLGLGERLVARGNTSTRLKLHLEGRAVAAVTLGDISGVDTRFPFILFVSQAETEDFLSESLRASGVVIERGTELVSFEREDDGLQCLLQRDDGGQERLHTRFLVGCDGAHSAVRKGSGIEFEGGSYPQDFGLGDVEADAAYIAHRRIGDLETLWAYDIDASRKALTDEVKTKERITKEIRFSQPASGIK